MRIRRMSVDDIPQVRAIEEKSFSQPWSKQGFLDALAFSGAVFLVAEDEAVNSAGDRGSMILGYIGMYISFDEGEITNVAVGDIFRGGGIGSALVEAMQREAAEAGVKRIVLEVRVSNDSAVHVYEKRGFQTLGVRKDFYELPKEDAFIMEWMLE